MLQAHGGYTLDGATVVSVVHGATNVDADAACAAHDEARNGYVVQAKYDGDAVQHTCSVMPHRATCADLVEQPLRCYRGLGLDDPRQWEMLTRGNDLAMAHVPGPRCALKPDGPVTPFEARCGLDP
jgi:hypothetical protein